MLPARMTMFCMVSLRCSSEGPSLRRDPAKAVGRLLQLPPLLQLAPKAPGGAGSRVCAATRLGAAGVAGGSRTDLGDQSGGGIGAFESTNTGTHSRTIVLAGGSEQTGHRDPDHAAQHRPTRLLFPGRARARRRKAMSSGMRTKQLSGFQAQHGIAAASTAEGPVPLHCEKWQ